ncbi:MAG: hypothetical protein JXR36_09535 [Bacteroidales bacterium]|nr:hypothetical protein [Bacteroidales bacterium]
MIYTRFIIITISLLISSFANAQFFAKLNTGYNLSLSKYGAGLNISSIIPNEPNEYLSSYHPLLYYSENKELVTIKPALGSGINNEVSFGYRNCFLAVELIMGMNLNALNFNNQTNQYLDEFSKTYTDITSADIPFYWRSGFDKYLNTEFYSSVEFAYNIIYFNPTISLYYKSNNFSFGASTGISFNFIDLSVIAESKALGYNDTYNRSFMYQSTMLYNPNKQQIEDLFVNPKDKENMIISYTIGIDFTYRLKDELELFGVIKYRPLYYSPAFAVITDIERITENNGSQNISQEEDLPFSFAYNTFTPYENTIWYEIRNYDFSTIGISMGIRYNFGKSENNEK